MDKNQSDFDILQKIKNLYSESKNSKIYQNWRSQAKLCWEFYEGDQWSEEEKNILEEYSQAPIVINKIATKIDSVSGTEISSRTRIAYRSRSGDRSEEETARALTDISLYIAEKNDQVTEISNAFRAGLVTGVGWIDVGVQNRANIPTVFNKSENELNIIFDIRSKNADYSDARFVAREKWIDANILSDLFGEKVSGIIQTLNLSDIRRSSILNYNEELSSAEEFLNLEEKRVKVVEVQFKQTEKLYTVKDKKGRTFSTFDKKIAYKEKNNEVIQNYHSRTYIAYFTEDVLLSCKPLEYDFNDFTLIPYFFKRKRLTGEPYGLVKSAIDPQREYNKRRSKALHLLNTSQVIADIDAVEDPNTLAREAARPDGIILKRPGKDIRIIRNSELASSQVVIMDQAGFDIQETTGVFDDNIGKKSNVYSGVAIKQRQIASTNNQMFAFDTLRKVKKKLGRFILSLIQQYFNSEMIINITDDVNNPRLIKLNHYIKDDEGNVIRDEQNNPVKLNDVKFGDFDIYIEEIKDSLSSQEYELDQLLALRNAGIKVPSNLIVESTSIKNKDKILEINQIQNPNNKGV